MTADNAPVTDDPAALLRLAVDIARDAGALLLSYATSDDLVVATKSSATDPVSDADHASEQLISDRLDTARPHDGLMGEEHRGDRAGTTGLRWVVDPLDGTVNFLYGVPQWAVSVAVEDRDGPLAGVVHDPNRDETFTAVRGAGAHLNGRPLQITPSTVADALIATGFSYDPQVRRHQADMLTRLVGTVRDVRRFGSAALDLCWTAAGRWDGYAEFGLHRWDYSAASLVITEAGGTVAAWEQAFGGDTRMKGVSAGGDVVAAHLAAWLETEGARPIPLDDFVE